REAERADGGQVERAGQRGAQADQAWELLVVVVGAIEPGGRGDLQRRVFQERGGGEEGLIEGEGVEKRLEGGARLPPRLHGIHVPGRGEIAAAAHVGEHVTRRVVHHEDRSILNSLIAHGEELAGQRVDDDALETTVERGGDADGAGTRIA